MEKNITKVLLVVGFIMIMFFSETTIVSTKANSGLQELKLVDGTYEVKAKLKNNEDEISIKNPTRIIVSDGNMNLKLVIDNDKYDCVFIGEEKIEKLENSKDKETIFEIPITSLDDEVKILLNESDNSNKIECVVTFDESKLKKINNKENDKMTWTLIGSIVAVVLIAVGMFFRGRRKNRR